MINRACGDVNVGNGLLEFEISSSLAKQTLPSVLKSWHTVVRAGEKNRA
jgi:hypothetical protein